MKKANIVEKYNAFIGSYGITPQEFVLSAGGTCVMLGLREQTQGMDMDVSAELFYMLKHTQRYRTIKLEDTEALHWNEHIKLHVGKPGPTQVIDGVCCFSVLRLLEQKRKLNRPKDRTDIAALMKLLY